MPGPTLTFAFILSTLIGALFHLVFGGDVRRLAMFLLGAWVGFALGHLGGVFVDFNVLSVGALRTLPAVLGAVIMLIFTQAFLSTRQTKR